MADTLMLPETALMVAQRLLDSNAGAAAQKLLDDNKVKYVIKNGKIINANDTTEVWLDRFITENAKMLELKGVVRKLAKIDDEVLIQGPTGTGKELIAHALHGTRSGLFRALNCAGLPEHLIESELFGHVRGAFTGATSDKIGLMINAKEGTLFLDEIGELPLLAQGKLLRVLQDKKIRRVGDVEDKDISCRFVFATNRDIKQMCKDNTFRIDLYARISTFELHTLPLNERPEDVVPILKSLGGEKFISSMNGVTLDTPFNCRSLEQYVKRYNVFGKIV